jgi:hypothetical protein
MKIYKRDLKKLLKLYDRGEINEQEYFELKRELEKIHNIWELIK